MINKHKQNKQTTLISIVLMLGLAIGQSYQEIANKMTVENYFTDQITDAIQTTVLDRDEFVVKVKVDLSNSRGASSTNMSQQTPTVKPKAQSTPSNQNTNSLRWITGTGTAPPQASPSGNDQQAYSSNKFNSGPVSMGDIVSFSAIIYLDERIATGAVKESIEQIVTDYVPDQFYNCSDCIEIKTMQFKSDDESDELNELKEQLESVRLSLDAERGKVDREKEEIINKRIEALEEMLEDKQYQLEEFLDLERSRILAQDRKDSIETADLREYKKQSIDDTKERLEEAETRWIEDQQKAVDDKVDIINKLIEEGKPEDTSSDEEEGWFWENIHLIIGGIIVFLFLVILIVVLTSGKKQPVQTVYLKPKGTKKKDTKKKDTKENGSNKSEQKDEQSTDEKPDSKEPIQQPSAPQPTFAQPTMAHQDDNVVRSEMQSMRQSAVSMSVGQKEGASQLIKDWLADSPDGGSGEEESTEE